MDKMTNIDRVKHIFFKLAGVDPSLWQHIGTSLVSLCMKRPLGTIIVFKEPGIQPEVPAALGSCVVSFSIVHSVRHTTLRMQEEDIINLNK
jgi:hypothetical protein